MKLQPWGPVPGSHSRSFLGAFLETPASKRHSVLMTTHTHFYPDTMLLLFSH